MKKLVKLTIFIGIIYYLLKDINFSEILKAFESYSILWSFIVMLSVVLSDYFLSLRWQFLTKFKISLMASFEAIGISAFLNFILPAKTGELSKIVYLKKFYKFRSSNATAILVMERVFDVLILGIITLIMALYLLEIEGAVRYSLITVLVVLLFFAMLRSKGVRKLIRFIPNQKLRHFVFRTFKHTFLISEKKDLMKNFFYSLLVWMSYFLTVYLFLVYVAGFMLTLQQVFIIFVISSVAMSIPLLPGGIGTYQAGVVFALGIYGIGKEEALLAGILLQIYNLVPSFIVAVYIIERKGISLKSFKNE
ncbi:MAG: flippase-like domain-containing protein [Campylobacterales bacterium]|nr:flippase-like domain-containing protein [Campylobacterales bacterium]